MKTTLQLSQLLADIQVAYTNLRGFHWNIKGREFYVLHSKFEDIYNDLSEKADEIAERILMLGETPAHNYSEYIKISKIKETGVISDGDKALGLILDYYQSFMNQEKEILKSAAENEDEVTIALMTDYLKEQEKFVWMLKAFMSK